MKFASAKKIHWISRPNGPPTLVFHEILKNRCFLNAVVPPPRLPCKFKCFIASIYSTAGTYSSWENAGSQCDRARFEKSRVMSPKNINSMTGIRLQKCPSAGLTLQEWRSTSHVYEQARRRQRRNIIEFHAQTAHQRQYFMKLKKIYVSWKTVGPW